MYPKNAASPRCIYAKVVSAADGSPITTGVTAFHVQASTRGAVGGTAAAHIAYGLWGYTPTQAETNYDTFAIEFYHADAVGDGPVVQVVTGADAVWNDTLAEDYPAFEDTAPTARQMMWMMMQSILQNELDDGVFKVLKIDETDAATFEVTKNALDYPVKRVRAT
jgi:hypothetical protein